jgi:RES domain-containing protein
MRAWRISKRRYAQPPESAFNGEGSRRCGGRWSPPGLRVAYTSSSLALASLEYFVNLEPVDAPADLVSVGVDFPRGFKVDRVMTASLPHNWRHTPAPIELRDIGANWLDSASSLCLIVPSSVIPEEFNLLINPAHPDFKHLRFFGPRRFAFDPRLGKRSLGSQ